MSYIKQSIDQFISCLIVTLFHRNDGKEWEPSKNSKVCSQHFVGGFKSEDPRSPAYNPSIFDPKKTNLQKAESKEMR